MMRKRLRRYWVAFAAAATIALVGAGSAYAVTTYCNEFLYNGWERTSGWCECWWATDVTKDPGASRLGFENHNGRKYEQGSGTYIYTDSAELQIWGYKRADVKRVSPGPAYHNADVCVC